MAERATARPPQAAFWTVLPFGFTEEDLCEFADRHFLFRHPDTGNLYAQPKDIMAYLTSALRDRQAALAGTQLRRPSRRPRKWRKRVIRLPI